MSRTPTPTPGPPPEPMPDGITNVYIFDTFNTMSWIVVQSTPMILYLQHLNASATILAVAAGMAPLLNILQMPAARFVEQVGYRRFVLAGWTSRSFLIIGMAIVTLLPESVDPATRIVLMLFLSFLFNALRGISVCGVLPWFTHIVPESRRGEFLARDQFAVALSTILSFLVFGLLLSGGRAWYSFGVVYSLSFVSALVSLYFLRRIPDVPVEKITPNPAPLPWKDMLFHPPFFRYLRYILVINFAFGISNVFWVRFFRVLLHASDTLTLVNSAITIMVLAIVLFLVAPMIDRTGNKTVLMVSGIGYVVHFLGWASVAAGLLPFNWVIIAWQALTAGFSGALWSLANIRAVMGIVPVMGRPHFLALYSVASNVTLGIAPLLCGPVVDYLGHWHVSWMSWSWNSYSLLYCGLSFTIFVGVCVLRTIDEPHQMTWDVFMTELLVKTPSRAVSRLVGRLRGPGTG
ncbi:MAG: MFS transporter [Methylacidiphilales bacterium]|nr:MFS transporter [Candidatus Methylacidiphilales bacterium]